MPTPVPVGTAAPTAQGAGFQNDLTNAHNNNAQPGAPLMEAYIDRFGRTAFRFVDPVSGQPFNQPQVIQPVGDTTGVATPPGDEGTGGTGDTGDGGFGTGSSGLVTAEQGSEGADIREASVEFGTGPGITGQLDIPGTAGVSSEPANLSGTVVTGLSTAAAGAANVLGLAVPGMGIAAKTFLNKYVDGKFSELPFGSLTRREAAARVKELNEAEARAIGDVDLETALNNMERDFFGEQQQFADNPDVAPTPPPAAPVTSVTTAPIAPPTTGFVPTTDFTQDDFDRVSEVAAGLAAISEPLGDDFSDEDDTDAGIGSDGTAPGDDTGTSTAGGFGDDQQEADNPGSTGGDGDDDDDDQKGKDPGGGASGSPFHQGGFVHSHQAKDAKLLGGEFIMNRDAVRQKGTEFFDKLNDPVGFAAKKKAK